MPPQTTYSCTSCVEPPGDAAADVHDGEPADGQKAEDDAGRSIGAAITAGGVSVFLGATTLLVARRRRRRTRG